MSEGDKKGKRACSECHKSKSKCVYPPNNPDRCERCIRLDKECVPHKSRQGKRKSDYMSDGGNNGVYSDSMLQGAAAGGFGAQQGQQGQQQFVGSSGGHQMEVTSSSLSQFSTPMAAALTMSNNNGIGNQSQQNMFTVDNTTSAAAAGLVTDGTASAAGLTNVNLLNHNHMSNLLANNAGVSGNNFSPAAATAVSMNNLNTHHLAQQIQNNTLFAKNGLLQQPYGVGDGNNNGLNGNTGLNAILTRAMGDNNRAITNNTAVSGATPNNGGIDMSSAGNLQGFSTNLLSGLSPAALNRMISCLSNNINAATNANAGGGGGDVGSNNNLNLLYQAANSQSGSNTTTTTTTTQPQHQQGMVNYNGAQGGDQMIKACSTTPSNSGTNGSNINTSSMMNSQTNTAQRSNSTGGIGTTTSIHPSPLPSLPNNNTKSSAAPVPSSSSNNSIINNNNISSSSSNNNKTSNANTNSNNKAQSQIMRANDSRLKKQKKHHKFFPPEYPPISLLPSTTNHSITGTPSSSSQAGDSGENLSRSSSTQNFITPEEAIGNHYSACARHSELTLASLKYHYGLQCQIREWISMALARRSFALLSKASSLAHRCNMHMDRILSGLDKDCNEECEDSCGQNKTCAGPRMHYLLSMLLEPQSKISIPIEDRHMLLPHFPPAFLSVIGCQNGQFFQESEIRNRWIIVRETRCGISRFFCSPAFERNVLCWAHVSQIYEDNLADIHSLIFVKDQFRRFLACNAYQIWSHSEKGMPPRPVHAPKTRIRLLSKRWGLAKYQDDGVTNPVTKAMIQQVDDVMTIEMDLLLVSFPTMDKTTYYLEFFHPTKNNSSSAQMNGNPPIARGLSNVSSNNMSAAGENLAQGMEQKSPDSSSTNPPTFDDIMESEEWVGIDDVMASGDINQLMDALLN